MTGHVCFKAATLFVVIFLSVFGVSTAEEWRNITFPLTGGEDISCIDTVEATDTLYAGTSGGIHVSRDLGVTWDREKVPGKGLRVTGILVLGNSVYAAAEEGLYKKEGLDGTWRQIYGERELKGLCSGGDAEEVITWTSSRIFSVNEEAWREVTPGAIVGGIGKVRTIAGIMYASSGGEIVFGPPNTGDWRRLTLVSGGEDEVTADSEEGEDQETEDILSSQPIRDVVPMEPDEVIISTGKGIYTLRKGGLSEFIDTSGLPSAEVVTALRTENGFFAATDKKIFFRSVSAYSWKPVLEVSDGGAIREMKTHRSRTGKSLLLAVLSERLYMRALEFFSDEVSTGPDARIMISDRFPVGPDIRLVHKMAIEYAEVSPEKISSWRKAAQWRSVLPRLALDYDEGYSDKVEFYKSASTAYIMEGPRDKRDSWGVTLTWELPDLIWNSSQTSIDVRSKLMVQLRDDILEDVTRLYFERKRLVEEIQRQEEKDKSKTGPIESRIEELTAYIDAYTGGMFSKSL